MNPEIHLGPLATPNISKDLDRQVKESVKSGAKVLTGGEPFGSSGNFYPPTILTDIHLAAQPNKKSGGAVIPGSDRCSNKAS